MKRFITVYQLELWGFELRPDDQDIYELKPNKGFLKIGKKSFRQLDDDKILCVSGHVTDANISKDKAYIRCHIETLKF